MSQRTAQLVLTALFLAGAVVFVILDHDGIAVALIGAILGQATAKAVDKTVNGNGK